MVAASRPAVCKAQHGTPPFVSVMAVVLASTPARVDEDPPPFPWSARFSTASLPSVHDAGHQTPLSAFVIAKALAESPIRVGVSSTSTHCVIGRRLEISPKLENESGNLGPHRGGESTNGNLAASADSIPQDQ